MSVAPPSRDEATTTPDTKRSFAPKERTAFADMLTDKALTITPSHCKGVGFGIAVEVSAAVDPNADEMNCVVGVKILGIEELRISVLGITVVSGIGTAVDAATKGGAGEDATVVGTTVDGALPDGPGDGAAVVDGSVGGGGIAVEGMNVDGSAGDGVSVDGIEVDEINVGGVD